MLGRCWIMLARLEGLWGSMAVHVGPCGAHVGAMLGHVVSCAGLRGCHGCLCHRAKNITQKKLLFGNFPWPFGSYVGPCRAHVACGAHVGAMLGRVGSFGGTLPAIIGHGFNHSYMH